MDKIIKKRGIATYLSWALKMLAALWSVFAGLYLLFNGELAENGMAVLLISGAIIAPGVPVDISKIRQSRD